jgi:N-acetylglucosamine-6-sulfatase
LRRILASTLVAVATLAAALAAANGRGVEQSDGSRPNFVVVMTDDQRVDELGAMRTVRERLAGAGVTFTNAYATFPLCCPSRATFLTGQYAHNHGVMDNEWAGGGGYRAFDNTGSLPVALEGAGYRTGLVGKYMNEYAGPEIPEGWSHWAVRTRGQTLFDYRLNVDGKRVEYGSSPREYQTDVVARRGTRFIRQSSGASPFFLWTSFFAPHGESIPGDERWNPRPAPRHRGRYELAQLATTPAFNERNVSDKPSFVAGSRRLSRAAVRDLTWRHRSREAALLSVDDAVERFLRTLRRTGELDETVVVFVSDNGFLVGEHRFQHKEQLYEEATRVPLIMSGPGLPEGANYDGIVGNIDLAPTILDAAGVPPMREPDGRSLLGLLSDPEPERDILLETAISTAVRTPDWMYAEHRTRNGVEPELYDMRVDPFQLRSLAGDAGVADQQAALADRLDELRDCVGPSCG